MESLRNRKAAVCFLTSALMACGPKAGTTSNGDSGSPAPEGGVGVEGGGGTDGPVASEGGKAGPDAASEAGSKCRAKDGGTCSAGVFAFESPSTYKVPGGASGVAVADLNGDCKADILSSEVDNDIPGGLGVYLSNGDGTFAAPITVPFAAADPASFGAPSLVAIADLDGDGLPDIIGYPYLGYSLNQGGGTFGATVSVPVSTTISDGALFMATVDVTGDGNMDILLAGGNTLAVLANSGGKNPAFSETDTSFSPDEGGTFTAGGLAVADFNGDGKPDIVVSNMPMGTATPQLFLMLNNGDGTFANATLILPNGGPLTAGDFNGDGHPDLAFTYPTDVEGPDSTDSNVGVLINNGKGTFLAPVVYLVQGNSASYLIAADLSGNGKQDIVTLDYDNSLGSKLMNQGDGTFGSSSALPGATLYSPIQAAAGDFLGTGTMGLAVSLEYNGYGLTTFAPQCP
jgi:VCBS repeat protein